MGLIKFIKNAGEKIFKSEEKREEEKAALIYSHISKYGFKARNIKVEVDDDRVILSGEVDSQEIKNKIIVTAGNVEGIASVDDRVVVIEPEPEKRFYTVKQGDYLSKISKEVYGDANKYNVIFEANKPMLKDPDLIYPGQVLIIPPEA